MQLKYDESSVLHLPEGLLGFSQLKRYVLIEDEEIQPLRWLQCVDDDDLAFPVVDPHLIVKDYAGSIPAQEMESLEIPHRSDMLMLAVVIVPDDPRLSSANLKAPLLVNHRKMTGKQIILMDPRYDERMPLMGNTMGNTEVAASGR